MRAAVVALVLSSCSSGGPPATQPLPHVQPADAAAAVPNADAPPDPVPSFSYDWDAGRKRLDAHRHMHAHGCGGTNHAERGDECLPLNIPLAARGTVTSAIDADPIELQLDVGTDDGVSARHRAALLDDRGAPITTFVALEDIAPSQCKVRIPASDAARHGALHFVVMTDPPRAR